MISVLNTTHYKHTECKEINTTDEEPRVSNQLVSTTTDDKLVT